MASNSDLPLITKFKLHVLRLSRRVYTRSDGTINRRLFSLIDIKASAPATKLIDKTAISTTDIPIDPSRNLWFRLFTPSGHSDKPHLATKVPAVIASVNYRLTPEHKYPTQYDDSFDALKFIDAQNYAVLPANTDLSRCFIGGDSAGGNIAHHVTIRAFQKTNHFEKIKIIGILSVQPFFGGEERTESEVRLASAPVIDVKMTDLLWRNFLPEGSDRNHPAANVFGGTELSAEDAAALENLEFPNVLVIVGGNDPLQDWQRRYVNGLKNCGKQVELIEYSNAFHGFYSFQELPEFALLIEDVTNFIRKLAHSE
ncbi:hypothetical protein ABFS82_09G004600 [Erythranthe guttata]